MAQTIGQVNKCDELEKRDEGDKTLFSVSIEGFSMLFNPADNGGEVPARGRMVKVDWSTSWRQGKRPIFWMQHFEYI